jgi:4-hydroxy-4-methyl-2-oxoglutarate aldolase
VYTDLRQDFPRPDPITVEGFRGIWAATLADTMGRHGIMSPDIRPIFEGIQLVGVAATVLNYPNDNITTHQALTMLQPGDVLVLDEGDGNVTGSFGHNMSLQARNRGAVGLVTSGCIRDLRLLREELFPVFSRGVCARSAQKSTPGSVNMPVQVGGIVVCPGDIIVGDDDGVAVVPRADAADILLRARGRMEMEHQQAADIKAGKRPLEIVFGEDWVTKALKDKVRVI